MHNAGMIYGYARASTDAQDLSNQLAQLETAGCGTIFREKITAAKARIGPRCVRTRIGMADGLMPQGRVRV